MPVEVDRHVVHTQSGALLTSQRLQPLLSYCNASNIPYQPSGFDAHNTIQRCRISKMQMKPLLHVLLLLFSQGHSGKWPCLSLAVGKDNQGISLGYARVLDTRAAAGSPS